MRSLVLILLCSVVVAIVKGDYVEDFEGNHKYGEFGSDETEAESEPLPDAVVPMMSNLRSGSPVEEGFGHDHFKPLNTTKTFTELIEGVKEAEPPMTDSDGRRLDHDCTSFETQPFDFTASTDQVFDPWNGHKKRHCKLFIQYNNGGNFVCTGSLVGPHHLITSRHCTRSACLGFATSVRVACGYGYVNDNTQYTHFGTANAIGSVFYSAYDDTLGCNNGQGFGGNTEFDIQVLELDRSVGSNLGWLGWSSGNANNLNLNIFGYPGNTQVNAFVPFGTDKMFHRFWGVASTEPRVIHLDEGAVAFGGESGSAYYLFHNNKRTAYGVHKGGPSGCHERATKISDDFSQALRKLRGLSSTNTNLTPWASSKPYCQVNEYLSDVFNHFNGPIKNIGSVNHNQGTFPATVTLFNTGTLPTGNFNLKWYASVNNIISNQDTLLKTTVHNMPAYHVSKFTTNLPASFNGVYFIGVIIEAPNCWENDARSILLGSIDVTPSPTKYPTNYPTFGFQPIIPTQYPIQIVPIPTKKPTFKIFPVFPTPKPTFPIKVVPTPKPTWKLYPITPKPTDGVIGILTPKPTFVLGGIPTPAPDFPCGTRWNKKYCTSQGKELGKRCCPKCKNPCEGAAECVRAGKQKFGICTAVDATPAPTTTNWSCGRKWKKKYCKKPKQMNQRCCYKCKKPCVNDHACLKVSGKPYGVCLGLIAP